jgi:threonine dehydratase
MERAVSRADVAAAAERIRPYVVRTPLERSRELSALCGTDVWLKLECFQHTGSFKLRGALNALMALPARQPVITASAGNHGLGVARAAELLGMRATVIVPESASPAKVDALRASGADLRLIGQTYDEAEAAALELARAGDVQFVSAYNDRLVIAGGGTLALEIVADAPEVQSVLVPAGGGGLISGVGIAADGRTVVGVQSVASPALHAAFTTGARVSVDVRESLADGLAGNVEEGSITLELMRRHVQTMLLVDESEIAQAMRWLLEHEHVLVEGSAAVGVAALLGGFRPAGPVAVVLTGRNVAAAVLRQYVLAS